MFLKRAVALARAVGHEHGAGAQPAPIYPARRCTWKSSTAWRACAWARPPAHRRRHRARSPAHAHARLPDTPIPTLPPHLIEPFLNEPIIVERGELDRARASWPRRKTAS
jgi:hypothetical protein